MATEMEKFELVRNCVHQMAGRNAAAGAVDIARKVADEFHFDIDTAKRYVATVALADSLGLVAK